MDTKLSAWITFTLVTNATFSSGYHPYFELIRHDITEPIRLEADQSITWLVPLPQFTINTPSKTVKTNVMGTMNMLGLAKRVKARFLLASTSEVYGDPRFIPSRKNTGAASIRLGFGHATTRQDR